LKNRKLYVLISLLLVTILLNFASCSNSSDTTNGSQVIETIRKEPYLIYTGDSTSMTVAWQTNKSPESAYIEWGSQPSILEESRIVKETGGGQDEHQFLYTITGLKPNTRTYYRVIVDGMAYSGSFKTAPGETEESLSFYVYGDTRSNPDINDRILSGILSDMKAIPDERQTFCTHSGDFVIYGMDEIFWDREYFNRDYSNTLEFLAKIPLMTSCGNHETYHENHFDDPEHYGYLLRKYWPYTFLKEKNHCYYSVDYGPVHLAVIDQYTTDYDSGSVQHEWLKQDLENSKKPWKVVMFHRPGWSANILEKDVEFRGMHDNDEIIQKYYHPIFKENNVKVVLQGHIHYYARCSVEGIEYLTVGGGGAPLVTPNPEAEYLVKAVKKHHFGRIDIKKDEMNITIIDIDGNEIDSVRTEL